MKPSERKLDYKKMIQAINNIVDNDFCADMECKLIPQKSSPYSQEEAMEMSDIISKVYSISHCIYCNACNGEWQAEKGEGK